MSSLGRRISEARDNAGLTQGELAERCDVSLTAVQGWERDSKPPGRARLPSLAAALSVSVAYLMGEEDELPEPVPRLPRPRSASDDLLLQVISQNQQILAQNSVIIEKMLGQNSEILAQSRKIVEQNERLEKRLASIEGKLSAANDPGSLAGKRLAR